MALPEAEAISCIDVSNVTLLPAAGCNLGSLIFSNFTVAASAGFTAATIGLGPKSTASPTHIDLVYQLTATNDQTPPSALGPGDVLLSYAVKASSGFHLTGINL